MAAPNMVTLLGFCFILANVALLVIVMPDLVGPVRDPFYNIPLPGCLANGLISNFRARHGCT